MFVKQLLLLVLLVGVSVIGDVAVNSGASPYIVWSSILLIGVAWVIVRRKSVFRRGNELESFFAGLMLIKGIMELSYLLGAMMGVSKGPIVGGYLFLAFVLGVYVMRKK